MSAARDKLLHLMVPNNRASRMRAQQLDIAEQADAELELAQLSDIATDFGRITAGVVDVADGSVVADNDGITIESINTPTSINQLKFVTDDGYETGYYESYFTGTTPNRSGITQIGAERESGASGTGTAQVILVAHDGGATPTRIIMSNDDSQPYFSYVDHWGNFGSLLLGAYWDSFSQAVTTVAATLLTDTIQGNSLGSNGWVRYVCQFKDNNTSGANRTHTVTYNFGSLAFAVAFTVANVAANPSDPIWVIIDSWNDAATNSQVHMMYVLEGANNGSGTFGAIAPVGAWAVSAIDSTADIAVTIQIASNNNAAGQTVKGRVGREGPYYA